MSQKNNTLRVKATDLFEFDPMTKNQERTFKLWEDGENLVLAGSAGTGKTFVALYLALEEMLNEVEYDKIINQPQYDTVTVDDASVFQMMFGKDSALRKEYMFA